MIKMAVDYLFALVKSNTKNQHYVLKINNLGVSILYVDAYFVTHALHRTKHELIWFSGVVGSDTQIKFTQTLHRRLAQ
jgi:hypothetical protein